MSKIIYIAGPITGLNVDAYMEKFEGAEEYLMEESDDNEIINPAYLRNVLHDTATHEDYMDVCRVLINKADAIYLLKGWEKSKGAREELKHFISTGKEIILEEA